KEKAEQHYIAAGLHLKTLKADHTGNWTNWEKLLKTKIGIGKTRASELMQIADGRKTVEEVRAVTSKRTRESRKRSPLRSGQERRPITVEREFEETGRLVVDMNRHLVALIDGVIHDTYDSGGFGRRPVQGYWSQAAADTNADDPQVTFTHSGRDYVLTSCSTYTDATAATDDVDIPAFLDRSRRGAAA